MAGEASAPKAQGRWSWAVAGTGAGRAALGPEKLSPDPAGMRSGAQAARTSLAAAWDLLYHACQRGAPPAVGCKHPADPGTPALVPGTLEPCTRPPREGLHISENGDLEFLSSSTRNTAGQGLPQRCRCPLTCVDGDHIPYLVGSQFLPCLGS